MKKKLLFWEMIVSIMVISFFLAIFSYKNGWGLIGTERYAVTFVAAIGSIIITVFTFIIALFVATAIPVVSDVTNTAGAVATAVIIAVGALATAVAVIIAANGGGVLAAIITAVVAGGIVIPIITIPMATAVIIIIMKCKDFELSKSSIFASFFIEAVIIISIILTINFL